MKKYEEGYLWRNLPVGTKITSRICRYEYIILPNEKIVSKNGRISSMDDKVHFLLEDETLILPFGYQSPLWKVLNGENYE